MKGHVGAWMTSGLSALALALALLQALVLAHSPHRTQNVTAVREQSNRYSVPGGRSGIPWIPFDDTKLQAPRPPEGRNPPKQQEERRPPPPRQRNAPPLPGPHPARKAVV